MANYRISADLMALTGAQYINAKARPRKEGETDAEYDKVPVISGVFIPDKYNDIQVKVDNSKEGFRNASGLTANLNLNVSTLYLGYDPATGQPRPDQKLVDAAKMRVLQQGDEVTAYNIPSVAVTASFHKEFVTSLRQRIAAKLIKQHPEWANTTEESNADLRRAVSAQVPYRLGLGYLREPKNASANQASAAPVPAPSYNNFAAPQVSDSSAQGEATIDNDDLPF